MVIVESNLNIFVAAFISKGCKMSGLFSLGFCSRWQLLFIYTFVIHYDLFKDSV